VLGGGGVILAKSGFVEAETEFDRIERAFGNDLGEIRDGELIFPGGVGQAAE
jgi:hypothetical protein